MNSRVEFNPNPLLCGMKSGIDGFNHLKVLDRMEGFLKRFDVFDSHGKLKTARDPWEIGILCSIYATRALYKDLVVQGPFKYLLTARLNQDCLENFFSRIRGVFSKAEIFYILPFLIH